MRKSHALKSFRLPGLLLLLMATALFLPRPAQAAFGLTTDSTYYTVDTGAGLVFKIRRQDFGSSTQSPGDIASLVYKGVQYQDQARGSQVNSGFDFLYTGVSAVTVSAPIVNSNFIEIEVQGGDLTHYYIARNGYNNIYMGTYFTTEPSTLGLCRYILRIPKNLLPNGPGPSDLTGTDETVEAKDIFGFSPTNVNVALRGQTRSKHYSNMRLKDWAYIGATGSNVGLWVVRGNEEGGSGGPFYRCLLNQGAADQEITYIVNYGEEQTEAFRTGILDDYTLVFTNGATPALPVDTSFFSSMNMLGYVAPSGRGSVIGHGIVGRDPNYDYTVGFSNPTAQYWADADPDYGSFTCPNMRPGTYTMTVYKNELGVYTGTVTVAAGSATRLATLLVTADPSAAPAVWRVGDWDGTPVEFLNGGKIDTMHPSDIRMAPWSPGPFVVGTSDPATAFPCYQWKAVNGAQVVQFPLTAAQRTAYTIRVGLTCAFAGARPQITVNAWKSAVPSPSTQPTSRTLTVGSYRGNNVTYTYAVPATAFVTGTNTLTLTPASGTSGTAFLSPGYSIDAVDMLGPVRTVSGTVTLPQWYGGPQPLTFTLTPTNGTPGPTTTQTLTPSATGAFTLANVPVGTYTLGIKGSRWLRKDLAITVPSGPVTGLSATLVAGDINNDNQVTNADLALLRASFGSNPFHGNWNPNADLNGDGFVSDHDQAMLQANLGKLGDP